MKLYSNIVLTEEDTEPDEIVAMLSPDNMALSYMGRLSIILMESETS